jgi:hypothetical protein
MSTILRGRCHKGLYPLPSYPIKQACGATMIPLSRWHNCLGHPSLAIVKQVVNNYNLSYLHESSRRLICDACQQAKSHQLPYAKSSSVSSFPLELVFSDVWGPAPESVGRKNTI